MVWWFNGNREDNDPSSDNIAVKIERLSPNSRRIGGEITIDRPLDDVWAILTDYDNLSTHVPNLVESERVDRGRPPENGEPGDGRYECRLFQRGAQRIVGFEFAADVTMDMVESVVVAGKDRLRLDRVGRPRSPSDADVLFPEERHISFACVDSRFFSEFDGEWRVVSNAAGDETTLSYVVDVRPKGPVPVAALEWRIREDVPTNLSAVRRAARECGREGVLAARQEKKERSSSSSTQTTSRSQILSDVAGRGRSQARAALAGGRDIVKGIMEPKPRRELAPLRVRVNWDDNETMAAYLKE